MLHELSPMLEDSCCPNTFVDDGGSLCVTAATAVEAGTGADSVPDAASNTKSFSAAYTSEGEWISCAAASVTALTLRTASCDGNVIEWDGARCTAGSEAPPNCELRDGLRLGSSELELRFK